MKMCGIKTPHDNKVYLFWDYVTVITCYRVQATAQSKLKQEYTSTDYELRTTEDTRSNCFTT